MGCIKTECGVYDKTLPGCWQGLEPDKCGGPLIAKRADVFEVPCNDGVISPDSLKTGIFALMCMVKTILRQDADGRGIMNTPDIEALREHYGKMDKALKEMGL